MKKYLRIGIGVVGFLLVLGVLATPYWFGRETEKTYVAMIEQLSRSTGMSFTARQYQRGWLSSTAETIVRVPELNFEVASEHDIDHGPFPFNRVLAGDWQPVQAHIVSRIRVNTSAPSPASALPPLNAEILFHIQGGGTLTATMPALRKSGDHGQLIDWRGLNVTALFDRDWKHISFDAQMPAVNLSAPGKGDFSVSQVALKYDLQEGTAGYFFGDGALTVKELSFSDARSRVRVNGLEVATNAKPVGENVTLSVRYQLGTVHTGAEHYGPGMLHLELRHLDAAALVKFKKEIDGMYQSKMPPQQAAMMMTGKALELLGTLAKKAPELEITRLSFKTGNGEISGKAKFVLDGRKQDLGQNPLLLLTAIAGDIELSLPPSVVKLMLATQIRRDIEAYRGQGLTDGELARLDAETMDQIVERAYPHYLAHNDFTRHLVEENGQYKLQFSLRHGQMQLNGKPWRFPTAQRQKL